MKRYFLILIGLCAVAATAPAQNRLFKMERGQVRAFVGTPGEFNMIHLYDKQYDKDLAATYDPQYRDYMCDNAVVGVEYDYRVSWKSYLGASLSWTMGQDVCYDAVEDEAIGIRDIHNFFLMANWRWNWWSSERLALFSSVGLGAQFSLFLMEGRPAEFKATDLAWHINYIGIEYNFSDTFSGFADAGTGSSIMGLRLGLAYKF